MQMIVENVHDLIDRYAQSIMEPGSQGIQMVAYRRMGQRIGHDGFHVFFALGTVVAVNGVLGDHRLNLFGNVFDDPGPTALTTLQSSVTVWTALQTVGFPFIDLLGCLPPMARMPLPGFLRRLGVLGLV